MNKRIQELFDKAVSDVDYIRDEEYTNLELQKMYIPDCFAERFAELIVQECALLCSDPVVVLQHWGLDSKSE